MKAWVVEFRETRPVRKPWGVTRLCETYARAWDVARALKLSWTQTRVLGPFDLVGYDPPTKTKAKRKAK